MLAVHLHPTTRNVIGFDVMTKDVFMDRHANDPDHLFVERSYFATNMAVRSFLTNWRLYTVYDGVLTRRIL